MKIQILLISLATALLLGCSSTGSKPSASSNSQTQSEPKSWFCEGKSESALEGELKVASKEWDCSQLTKQEIAHRTTKHEQPKAGVKKEKKEKAVGQLAASKEPGMVESNRDNQATDIPNTEAKQFLTIDAKTPLYISLAHKVAKPTSLLDLPETFWAIQIMALQDQNALNSFVSDNELIGVFAAKIESEGTLFYVLLLGVYESRFVAEEAWESRPQSIRALKPYFRDLASLQNAMLKGENL